MIEISVTQLFNHSIIQLFIFLRCKVSKNNKGITFQNRKKFHPDTSLLFPETCLQVDSYG